MNTIKTVLTTIILALFLANCVQLDFIVNCKTVGQNKNIKENKEAPDKSWSVTIANQDTYKSSISTTSMMVLTRKTKTIKYDRLYVVPLITTVTTYRFLFPSASFFTGSTGVFRWTRVWLRCI
jgi:PBP1b-binding outer membrane lipoprotein LpoB